MLSPLHLPDISPTSPLGASGLLGLLSEGSALHATLEPLERARDEP